MGRKGIAISNGLETGDLLSQGKIEISTGGLIEVTQNVIVALAG